MSKITNFDLVQYVKKVIAGCKLTDATPEILDELTEAIAVRTTNRIIATVTSYFSDKEVAEVADLLQKNPKMEDFEALMTVAAGVPQMEEHLEKALDDLYQELTYDSTEIAKAMEKAKKN